jgi:hypothetical protein
VALWLCHVENYRTQGAGDKRRTVMSLCPPNVVLVSNNISALLVIRLEPAGRCQFFWRASAHQPADVAHSSSLEEAATDRKNAIGTRRQSILTQGSCWFLLLILLVPNLHNCIHENCNYIQI